MNKTISLPILFFFLLSGYSYGAESAIYRWVDKNGSSNFTDDYEKVPPEYRNQVEIKPSGQPSPKELTPPPANSIAAPQEAEKAGQTGKTPATGYAEKRAIYFYGKKVFDAERQITIIPGGDKEAVVISNLPYHYALVLPYSEEWKFTEDDRGILKGQAGPVNLTLTIYQSELPASAILSKVEERVLSHSHVIPIDNAKLIKYPAQDVYFAQNSAEKIDNVFKGVKMYNYFTVKKWKNIVYEYHLSRIFRPEELDRFDENKFLKFLTSGFVVDFAR
jgi:hypothetical protein